MKFVEAVNLIESRYGMQAFDHLEDYSEDEAVQILLEERKQSRAKNRQEMCKRQRPRAACTQKDDRGRVCLCGYSGSNGFGHDRSSS